MEIGVWKRQPTATLSGNEVWAMQVDEQRRIVVTNCHKRHAGHWLMIFRPFVFAERLGAVSSMDGVEARRLAGDKAVQMLSDMWMTIEHGCEQLEGD